MNNISFANPYLLLMLIPLLLISIVPFFIAIKRDRLNKKNVTSLCIHIVISILISFVMARFTYELVVTETNLYVLADVSYSANESLDKIDQYIDDLKDNTPKNTKIGVVAFAKDYEVLNEPGERLRSVKEAKVDDSATNIGAALKYTGSLFKNNVIKRIVIISDGKETNKSNIVGIVDELKAQDILIDAIYLDDNVKEDTKEVQISALEFNKATFKNKAEEVRCLIEASYRARGVISIYNKNDLVKSQAISLDKGLNVVNLPLSTTEAGVYDYRVELEGFNEDYSKLNNHYYFTQTISNEANVLFIGNDERDLRAIDKLYGGASELEVKYNIDKFYKTYNKVPYLVEDLAKYDEIVLSNLDVRVLPHTKEFINSLDIIVSEFGKKLITLGNTFIQEAKNDEILDKYSKILPTKYGNDNSEAKVIALVLDISKSLAYEDRVNIAREAALNTVDIMKENDMIMVIGFYGNVEIIQTITGYDSKEEIKEKIRNIKLDQGTSLGTGLQAAYNALVDLPYNEKQIMLISDGLPYSAEKETALRVADDLKKKNIILNSINTNQPKGVNLMQTLSSKCNGRSYVATSIEDAKNIVLGDVQDDLTDTVIDTGLHKVTIKNKNSAEVMGVNALRDIKGYYFNRAKNHTNVVLETKYTSKGGIEYDVPIYTTWEYGNGAVASFASDFSNYWTEEWVDKDSLGFIDNLRAFLIPETRISAPLRVEVGFDGTYANINVFAPSFSTGNKLECIAVMPDGSEVRELLAFNSVSYTADLMVDKPGKYIMKIIYTNGNLKYEYDGEFNISYSPEYDRFVHFEASSLYHMVSENGQVSEDGKLELKNDSSYVESYLYDFTIVFMVIAVVLFVADLIIRKLTIDDIKSFFKLGGGKRK